MIGEYKRTRYANAGVRPSLWLGGAIDYFDWFLALPEGNKVPLLACSWTSFKMKDDELARDNDALLDRFLFPAFQSLSESLTTEAQPLPSHHCAFNPGTRLWRGSGSRCAIVLVCRYDARTSGIEVEIFVQRIA